MSNDPDFIGFKTTLAATIPARESMFRADANYILERLLNRKRATITTVDKVAAYLEQIAIWSPHRQGLKAMDARNKARAK